MHTAWAKTQIRCVGTGTTPTAVIINGHIEVSRCISMCGHYKYPIIIIMIIIIIDTTVRFTYLGSDVDSSGYSSPDIRRHIGLATSTMGRLDRMWSNRRLSTTQALHLQHVYPTCPVAWLGDLDVTQGGREETVGLSHEMLTPTARGTLERLRHQYHGLGEHGSH